MHLSVLIKNINFPSSWIPQNNLFSIASYITVYFKLKPTNDITTEFSGNIC